MKKKLMRFNLAALALVMVTSVLISGTFAKYTTAVSAQDTALIARWNISSTGLGEITYDGEGNPQVQEMDLFGHAYDVAIKGDTNGDGTGTPILGPGVEDSFIVNLTGTADVDATIDLQIVKSGTAQTAPIQYAIVRDGKTFAWEDAETYDLYYSEELLAEAILNKMITTADKPANVMANDLVAEGGSKVAATATTAGEKAIILKNSEELTTANVEVHWRWPFNAGDHNQTLLKAAFERGTDWTDADDTELGKLSAAEGVTRTSYGLTLTLTAEQITPEVTNP